MNVSPLYAAAALIFLLGAAVLFLRVQQSIRDDDSKREAPLVSVGIERPDGVFGLAIAQKTKLWDKAVLELLLPFDCAKAARGKQFVSGALFVFNRAPDGGCILSSIKSLKGGARLAAGLRLNVNLEDKEGLMLLPGIGPKKAEAIVKSRKQDGLFLDAEALTRVWGIGPKTVQKLIPWIETGQAPPSRPK